MKKIYALALFATLCISCSGEDGMDGLQGLQGEQGIAGTNGEDGADGENGSDGVDGAQGETGESGENGEPGTANVIYSDWFTNTFPEAPIADDKAVTVVNVPALTEEVKNSGLILVYARRLSAPDTYSISQLPITLYEPTNEHYSFDYMTVANDNLVIRLQTLDGSNINFFIYREFRYVIVPGGIQAGGKSSLDYNKMSYEEVVEHFNIPK